MECRAYWIPTFVQTYLQFVLLNSNILTYSICVETSSNKLGGLVFYKQTVSSKILKFWIQKLKIMEMKSFFYKYSFDEWSSTGKNIPSNPELLLSFLSFTKNQLDAEGDVRHKKPSSAIIFVTIFAWFDLLNYRIICCYLTCKFKSLNIKLHSIQSGDRWTDKRIEKK